MFPLVAQAQALEQLIASALSSHPSAQVQRALTASAQAGVDSARWQYYPTPSVAIESAHASASDSAYQGDGVVSTLRLQQPIWTGGRLTAGMNKAEAGVIASQASLEEIRQQLALRVVQSYGDWLSAHLKILAYEQSMATHVRLRDQVKRRIEQGASADSDLILAVSRMQSIAADISVARAQKDIALARLGQLLGRPIDDAALNTTSNAVFAAPRPVNSGLPKLLDLALAVNPTIHKAQAQAKVQESVIAERRADLSPEVYLRAERQYGNYSVSNSGPENRLFIGLNSRFGAGLSSLSNVEGAKSQHQAALAEVEAQSRTVSEQVLADYALATSSESRLDALNASLEAAGQVSKSYDRQFLAGRKTWLDVMNAARELAQTELQLADIKSTQVVVTWRLAIYTQGIAAVVEGGQ
ncbi:MAG: TolC family protein [Pseudomonadota bacterium]|nr:TolC family protein [Pseudomonadota bacterium]